MRLPFPAHHLSPVPIPEEQRPKPSKLEGAFAPNTLLRQAVPLFTEQVHGSESVAVAGDGSLWMLDKWGQAWTATPDPSAAAGGYRLSDSPVAYTGPGRPLGFHFDAAGSLVICDSKGLLRLERRGEPAGGFRLVCLANQAAGRPIEYANDLDVAADGRIFFSDSTAIPPALNEERPRPWFDTMRSYMLNMFWGSATGRLLVHDPASGATEVLEEGLWFANGVALAADESFVAVVETSSMRVWRRWLKGPKAGTKDILIDRLPGFPDNINRASDGNFWLALVAPDVPSVHSLIPRPFLRAIAAWLPAWLAPRPKPWGCVLKVSPQGEVLQCLMDPDGRACTSCACAVEHGGKLFVGSLMGSGVRVLDLAAVAPAPAPAADKQAPA